MDFTKKEILQIIGAVLLLCIAVGGMVWSIQSCEERDVAKQNAEASISRPGLYLRVNDKLDVNAYGTLKFVLVTSTATYDKWRVYNHYIGEPDYVYYTVGKDSVIRNVFTSDY